ncbi:hypothetical protein [Amycolatopsis alba]|uniref:Uncharacterized protein n=1 Tax=Amycolatopsis alba DSM 44262 TaxID=1125972 RepID=A0A229R9K0_AMYAL|nr:hypothetical protein [Amycolatopsis alba]OXM43131.1 hypothetical protein CFP75_39720 [Amycolatopsis alba DSM 44262]
MVDSPVVERGVLTAPAQTWDAAARRPEVIKQMAGHATVGLDAAAELDTSRRQVFVLLPGQSSGGRGGARLT